jgi:hypothetical protein
MTLDDTEIIKTAIGWVATVGTTLTGAVGYLFIQVVSLNRKVGRMEAEISEYKNDIAEYKNCPVLNCYFRVRRLNQDTPLTITRPTPSPA